MKIDNSGTIFAAASGAGRAAIAVLRVSGPATRKIVASLAGGRDKALRGSRQCGSYDKLNDNALLPANSVDSGEEGFCRLKSKIK